ncbi:hypothetical protein ACQY0O_001648 [Thecaphora frezii]
MSSLLSPFNFGQKQAYFHVQITIHELANVPLVAGYFSCKWHIKGSHSLATLQHSAAQAAQQHAQQHGYATHANAAVAHGHHADRSDRPSADSSELPSASSSHTSFGPPGSLTSRHSERTPTEVTVTTTTHDVEPSPSAAFSSSRSLRHSVSSATVGSVVSSARPGTASTQPKSAEPHRVNFFTEVVDKIVAKRHPHRGDDDKQRDGGDGEDDEDANRSIPEPGPSSAEDSPKVTLDVNPSSSSSRLSRRGSEASRRTTNSTKTTGSKLSKKAASLHSEGHRLDAEPSLDPFLFFTQQPRGETEYERVRDHSVKWNTSLQAGIRVPIEKPRPGSHHSGSSTPSHLHHHRDPAEKSSRSRRDGHGQAQDPRSAWGYLAASELRISVKQDLPSSSKAGDAPTRMGFVILNLAEFAPEAPPPTLSGSGRDHYHHHHNHHHYHHHPHYPHHHIFHHYNQARTTRSETRRFLLNESRTNATLKITVEMTYIGGAREYAVPPLKKGLLAGGVTQMLDGINGAIDSWNRRNQPHGYGQARDSRRSSGSDSSSIRHDGWINGSLTLAPGSANQRNPTCSNLPSSSNLSLPQLSTASYFSPVLQNAQKRKVPNRIPSKSFIDSVGQTSPPIRSGRNSAAFALSSNAHHEKPPEDIVNAIFSGVRTRKASQSRNPAEQQSSLNNLLSATVTRSNVIPRGTGGPAVFPSSDRVELRTRKASGASNISKKSDRSFTFGYSSKSKDKSKAKDKDKEKATKAASAKPAAKGPLASPASSFKLLARGGNKDDGGSAPASIKSVPSEGTGNASAEARPNDNADESRDSSTNSLTKVGGGGDGGGGGDCGGGKKQPSIRWNLDDNGNALTERSRGDGQSRPRVHSAASAVSSSSQLLKPPSMVVEHAYVPIRAGGIQAASQSDLDLSLASSFDSLASRPSPRSEADGTAEEAANRGRLSPPGRLLSREGRTNLTTGLGLRLDGVPLRPRFNSHQSDSNVHAVRAQFGQSRSSLLPDDQGLPVPLGNHTQDQPRPDAAAAQQARMCKPSASDLRSTYRTQLPFASGLGSGAVVRLERIKKTSRAMGEFAKDKLTNHLGLVRSHMHGAGATGEADHEADGTASEGDGGRKKLSRGALGIEPTEAVSRGWKGAGWRIALEPEIINPFLQPLSPVARPTTLQHGRQNSDISVYYDLEDDDEEADAGRAGDDGEDADADADAAYGSRRSGKDSEGDDNTLEADSSVVIVEPEKVTLRSMPPTLATAAM